MNWLAVLFPYRTHLENELKQQRSDFEKALAEKNLQIRLLRGELAAAKAGIAASFESPQRPLQESFDKYPAKSFVGPQDWQGELNKMLQEEEDGIRNRGRIQEHEPPTDDGA